MKSKSVFFALAIASCVSMASAQVTGSGTKNTVPLWTGSTSLGDSSIIQKSGNVGIGTKKPTARLDVETKSTTLPAVGGNNTATSGLTFGVVGVSASSTQYAAGVLGVNTATTGVISGVTGQSNSTSGAGVVGLSPDAGIVGYSEDCSVTCVYTPGNAGIFVTASGGNVLVGINSDSGNVVRVDSTGKGFFDGGTQTGGADFAESVAVAESHHRYEPGDLLVVDTRADRQLALSSEPYSPLVAGIYSTKPGVLATPHKMDEAAENEIPLAIVGIVPCKVSAENGSINRGDLLVTSSTPGRAMKGTDRNRMLGAVVGKALEPLSDGEGVIQVLVTLQ